VDKVGQLINAIGIKQEVKVFCVLKRKNPAKAGF